MPRKLEPDPRPSLSAAQRCATRSVKCRPQPDSLLASAARGEREPRAWIEDLDAQDAVSHLESDLDIAVLVHVLDGVRDHLRDQQAGVVEAFRGELDPHAIEQFAGARGAESDFGNVSE